MQDFFFIANTNVDKASLVNESLTIQEIAGSTGAVQYDDDLDFSSSVFSVSADDYIFYKITYAPQLNLFVTNNDQDSVYVSGNGVLWTRVVISDGSFFPVQQEWSPDLGIFVLTLGNTNIVKVSTDGYIWNSVVVATGIYSFSSICWSSELGIFTMASQGTFSMFTSTNGLEWTEHPDAYTPSLPAGQDIFKICWSPSLLIFVGVIWGAQNSLGIRTSVNGRTWDKRVNPSGVGGFIYPDVCWSPELGIFIIVSVNLIMTSVNGLNWETHTSPANNNWWGITWSAYLGIFVAVSPTVDSSNMMFSVNGVTWESISNKSEQYLTCITWAANISKFVCIGHQEGYSPPSISLVSYNPTQVSISQNDNVKLQIFNTDIISFDTIQINKTDPTALVISKTTGVGGERILTVDSQNNQLKICNGTSLRPSISFLTDPTSGLYKDNTATSLYLDLNIIDFIPDSTGWSPTNYAYSPTLKMVVTPKYVRTTVDGGNTWLDTPYTGSSSGFNGVCWADKLGIFVVTFDTDVGGGVYAVTFDGITWTEATTNIAGSWGNVAYSGELDLFVAMDYNGTSKAMTSADGLVWTEVTTADVNNLEFQQITYSPKLQLFVTVAPNTNVTNIQTFNGYTWTVVTKPINNAIDNVLWVAELELFVVICATVVLTSVDGTTWIQRRVPTNNLRGITYSQELALVVSNSQNGTIIFSSDAINWALATTSGYGTYGNIESIIWVPTTSTFLLQANALIDASVIATPTITLFDSVSIANNSTEVLSITPNSVVSIFPIQFPSYSVSALPSASIAGQTIYVYDSTNPVPCLAFSNGSDWKRCDDASTTVS